MNNKSKQEKEERARPNFNSRTMFPRNQEECDIAACDAEYACGLMGDRSYEQMLDWKAEEAAAERAFDEWHKLGPQSAQY